MKKLFFASALASTLSSFAQSPATYNYKAKFVGVDDASKATPAINSVKSVFNTSPSFNESNGAVEFTTNMSISSTVFSNMMSGEGLKVASFEKSEMKNETGIENKKSGPSK